MNTFFSSIPRELIFEIISYIKIKKDLESILSSDKYLEELFSDDAVWKILLIQSKSNYINPFTEQNKPQKTFKDLYMVNNLEKEIYTFGANGYGQLGHGNLGSFLASEGNEKNNFNPLIPTKIEGFNNVIQVSCGGRHIAFLTTKGELYTCGNGEYGQLGHGDQEDISIPKKIEGIPKVLQVSCGALHTAFITFAGEIYTFGIGNHGQLGHMNLSDQLIPKKIERISEIIHVICDGDATSIWTKKGGRHTFGTAWFKLLNHDSYEKLESFPDIIQICCKYYTTAFIRYK